MGKMSKPFLCLFFIFNSPQALGIVTCGDPEKGYYAEFPNLEFISQYGLKNITLFRNGNLLDFNNSLFSETAYRLPSSDGAPATTLNQTFWRYKDGLEVTLTFEDNQAYLRLTRPHRKLLRLPCKEEDLALN